VYDDDDDDDDDDNNNNNNNNNNRLKMTFETLSLKQLSCYATVPSVEYLRTIVSVMFC
jgi:hypothetical protein